MLSCNSDPAVRHGEDPILFRGPPQTGIDAENDLGLREGPLHRRNPWLICRTEIQNRVIVNYRPISGSSLCHTRFCEDFCLTSTLASLTLSEVNRFLALRSHLQRLLVALNSPGRPRSNFRRKEDSVSNKPKVAPIGKPSIDISEQIARRVEIHGREHGRDVGDRFRAEAEITGRTAKPTTLKRVAS
jgi:hypothetical protein